MLPVCCVQGAVQGSGRVLHILASGVFQLLSKHKYLPYLKRKFLFLAESPCGVMWGEVATGNIPSLWEGAMESMKWAEGSRGPAHLGLVFFSSSVYISYGEKHVLQEEAQQNYHLLGYLDTQCENKAGGRNSTSCIRKGMGAERQLPVVLITSCKEAALCKIPSYAL